MVNNVLQQDELDAGGVHPRIRILVAEQDDRIRPDLVRGLRADGYEVVDVTNGVELLDELGNALLSDHPDEGPDAIIMDALMPGVSGLSILSGLRAAHWQTPIVIIARKRRRDLREASGRLGADAVFERPFDIDDLRTCVLNFVSGAEHRAVFHA